MKKYFYPLVEDPFNSDDIKKGIDVLKSKQLTISTQTHKLENDTRIAAIGIGYGDGFPRKLSNTGKVFYNNNFFNIVGRVSMDIITVDIGDKDIKVGCNVELWGENINIKEVAKSIDSIPYELMCALGNRLDKEYI